MPVWCRNIAKKEMKGYVKAIPSADDEEALDNMVEEIKRQLKQRLPAGRYSGAGTQVDPGKAVIERLLDAKLEDEELSDLWVLSDDSLAISAARRCERL